MFTRVLNFTNLRLEMLGGLPNSLFLIIIAYHSVFYSFFIKSFYSSIGILYILGAVLSITIFTIGSWPENTKKYHGFLWFLSLFICLPLPYFLEFFTTPLTPELAMRIALCILILSIVLDWVTFLIMMFISLVVVGNVVAHTHSVGLSVFFSNTNMLEIVFILVMMILISFILMKKRQEAIESRLMIAKSIADILSHEIRTPLTKLHLNTGLLESMISSTEHSPEKLKDLIKKIINSEKQISSFVDTTLIRIDNEVQHDLHELSVIEEIRTIIDCYKLDSTEHFDVKIDILKDFVFLGDSLQFRHIIFNLLKNSIYFMSSTKNPTITISTENMYDMNVLAFEDNGSGIDTKSLENIFNIYFTTKSSGSGIGLYFCKKVMEKFGGRITCESEKNKYTRFKLYFPKI